MTSFLTLIRREYLEHRTAFLYAPLILVLLFALFAAMSLASGHIDLALHAAPGLPAKLFDGLYFAIAVLWWGYLAMLLFFYFADAYHADVRNNAMLFWKSMPQSDFKILLSKLLAGLTIFPALVFGAALLSGIVIIIALQVLPLVATGISVPALPELVSGWAQMSVVLLWYLVLALLWYAPFLAWVGLLSTLVGRWAIPLAIAIPLLVSMFEGVVDFSTAPGGSYLLTFLKQRGDFRYDSLPLLRMLSSFGPIDVPATLHDLTAGFDWPQAAAGLVFAVVVIYLASLYRQRVIKG